MTEDADEVLVGGEGCGEVVVVDLRVRVQQLLACKDSDKMKRNFENKSQRFSIFRLLLLIGTIS